MREAAGWMRWERAVEVEARRADDDDLAVEHAALGQVGQEGLDELGEVTRERLLVAAAELDLDAVAEDDAAEAVPLRLVDKTLLLRASRGRAWPASVRQVASPAGSPGHRTGAGGTAQGEPWRPAHSKRRSSGPRVNDGGGIDPGLRRPSRNL